MLTYFFTVSHYYYYYYYYYYLKFNIYYNLNIKILINQLKKLMKIVVYKVIKNKKPNK